VPCPIELLLQSGDRPVKRTDQLVTPIRLPGHLTDGHCPVRIELTDGQGRSRPVKRQIFGYAHPGMTAG